MRSGLLVVALLSSYVAADTAATLMPLYTTVDGGSCRLLGITGSKSTKFASIPGKLMSTCARCVQVTCNDPSCTAGSSVIAYVSDVPTGNSSEILLSPGAISSLTSNTVNKMPVKWKFTTCPADFISGNIQACTMEGIGASYTPIQFVNSHRVITSATINGNAATPSSNGYYFSTNVNGDSNTYLKDIKISVTANGQTLTGTVSYDTASSRSCADLGVQFTKPSDSEGSSSGTTDSSASKASNPSTPSSSSSNKTLIIAIVCGVVGLLLVIGIVVCVIRRRRDKEDEEENYDHQVGTDRSVVHKDHTVKKDPLPPPPPSAPVVPPSTTNDFPPTSTAAYARMDSDPPSSKQVPPSLFTPQTFVPETIQSPVKKVVSPPPKQSPGVPHQTFASTPQPSFKAPIAPTQQTYAPLIVSERQPSEYSRAAVRASYQSQTSVTSPGHAYSEMFSSNDGRNGGLYARGSVRDERKSFDIDEERDDDSPVNSSTGSNAQLNALLQAGALSLHDNEPSMTSPQSYVRATQLPRNSRTQAPTFPAPTEIRPSGAGYSRDSLNLLDYSRTKKQGSSAVQF
ncbi:hypothetical protein THRCLA_03339 [Thraustotheca clavata]|uniref:Expansin-like EG45 domain-containing protein n=1 Tax=Thraustotheca clavata TaxID=74557 RepID=A0A1W0A2B6_9STRA|nr:hypothetical protein THRCLA_03339 [Thraustotheca clavata]